MNVSTGELPTTLSTKAEQAQRYAVGYNDGWEHAVTRFNTVIIVLFLSILFQELLQTLERKDYDHVFMLNDTEYSVLNILYDATQTLQFSLAAYMIITQFIPPVVIQ